MDLDHRRDSWAAGRFPTTHWSRLISAGDPNSPKARESLAEFCQDYWYPIYAFIRRRGHDPEKALDLTQDFFARILEKEVLSQADPTRGRFRSFLRTVCAHFLSNRRDWEVAKKRGGGQPIVALHSDQAERQFAQELADHLTPERIFDRTWAMTLLQRVLDRLGRECRESGKNHQFEALRGFLVGDEATANYNEVAAQLGISPGAARVVVHRLRQRYAVLLREAIAATVADPSQVEDEIRDLFRALEP